MTKMYVRLHCTDPVKCIVHIKVNILEMEIGQRIHVSNFTENGGKNHLLVTNVLGQDSTLNFVLKLLKLLENHV